MNKMNQMNQLKVFEYDKPIVEIPPTLTVQLFNKNKNKGETVRYSFDGNVICTVENIGIGKLTMYNDGSYCFGNSFIICKLDNNQKLEMINKLHNGDFTAFDSNCCFLIALFHSNEDFFISNGFVSPHSLYVTYNKHCSGRDDKRNYYEMFSDSSIDTISDIFKQCICVYSVNKSQVKADYIVKYYGRKYIDMGVLEVAHENNHFISELDSM